ncbi:nucleotidyltransferase domain-containing protein [Candidatus Woesearchaeota archaeon]|nr:nucleotidyltransferase domain-containing protein [Candidatus Woesearchaeota archaeon]
MDKQTKSHLEEIIKYLKDKYSAKAIILCGSRVVSDYSENSDWDMFVFTSKHKNWFDKIGHPELPGMDLDICFFPTTQKYTWKDFGLKLRYSEIIYDPIGIARKIKKQAFKVYDKGPAKWTKEYAFYRKEKASRYMKKMEDLLEMHDNNRLFLRIAWHFTENIIDWWFGLRQEWPLRPKQAFEYIKNQDPKFYKQLQVITSDEKSYHDKIKAFKRVHTLLFESPKYKILIK